MNLRATCLIVMLAVSGAMADDASLQRGAKLYINYCLGCHSLGYLRYNTMAKDIGIVDEKGQVAEELLKTNLIFSDAKIGDVIETAMPSSSAEKWFGEQPPDLTLVGRVRGENWLIGYLKGFYVDKSRPFGVNNLMYPDVAMPNVLAPLQGIQISIYENKMEAINGQATTLKAISHLELRQPGLMSPAEFDLAVNDIVNFLMYTAAPESRMRHSLGYWVIGFLVIFAIVTFLLKREYWKDVNKK